MEQIQVRPELLLTTNHASTETSKTTVTIGICVRNAEKTIRRTIESVNHQDYPHCFMELILVDDDSADFTLSIVKEIVSKLDFTCRVFHGPWQGLGKSRNTVVKNAHGDYIIWVDGDIVLAKDYVRKQVEFMEQNPRVGIAGGQFGILHGRNLIATLDNAEVVVKDHIYGKKARSKPIFVHFGMAGTILRVKAIRQVNGFDDNIRGAGEDADIANKITQAGWLIYTANEAIFYHEGKEKLRDVWTQNVWYGYSYFFLNITTVTPESLFSGIRYAHIAYTLLREKRAFLLPFYYYFKKLAWIFGFIRGYVG